MTVNGTALSMVRGDSESISVTPSIPFESGDVVFLTVRKTPKSAIIFQKTATEFDNGVAYINIEPEDTNSMEFGDYVYDIQVTWSDGRVKTIVEKSVFKVKEEVTY